MKVPYKIAIAGYLASIPIILLGILGSVTVYPGGFDWVYQVMSDLASTKHNPEGGTCFAIGIAAGMTALIPVQIFLWNEARSKSRLERWASAILGVGVLAGIAIGLERLLLYSLSDLIRKGHELIALLAFFGLYAGTLGIALGRAKRISSYRWVALLVALPLIAVGVSQLSLYFSQRDLGWVDAGWRDLGISIWLSFAFWQWLASGLLWLGIGTLLLSSNSR